MQTPPTRPVPRVDVDTRTRARHTDEIQILSYLGKADAPIPLDELARRFPDRAHAIVGLVAKMEMDGLVLVTSSDAGKVVAITHDGRALDKRS